MSSQSEVACPGAAGDATQFSRQEIEDFLVKLRCLVDHQGYSQIGNVLAQVTDLERNHNSLMEETQRREDALKQEIVNLEEKDKELRRRSLTDYTESVEGLNTEKSRLSKENKCLKIEIERCIKATEVAEQQLKTQRREAEALGKEMQQHEEIANSAKQQLQEVQRLLSDAQQSAKKFDENLKRRDLTESRLKEKEVAARSETQELQMRNERLQKKFDRIKSYVVPTNDIALTDL